MPQRSRHPWVDRVDRDRSRQQGGMLKVPHRLTGRMMEHQRLGSCHNRESVRFWQLLIMKRS
jgi:hypothetical protein